MRFALSIVVVGDIPVRRYYRGKLSHGNHNRQVFAVGDYCGLRIRFSALAIQYSFLPWLFSIHFCLGYSFLPWLSISALAIHFCLGYFQYLFLPWIFSVFISALAIFSIHFCLGYSFLLALALAIHFWKLLVHDFRSCVLKWANLSLPICPCTLQVSSGCCTKYSNRSEENMVLTYFGCIGVKV